MDMTAFWRCEWMAIAYFLYLIVAAAIVGSQTPASRRVRVVMIAFRTGRYHCAPDVAAGMVLAVVAFALAHAR